VSVAFVLASASPAVGRGAGATLWAMPTVGPPPAHTYTGNEWTHPLLLDRIRKTSDIMSRYLIVATASADYPIDVATFQEALEGLADVACLALPYHPMDSFEEDAAIGDLASADGIFVRIGYLSARLIANLPLLKVITLHGVGVDQVDLNAAAARGILVTNVPGANAQAVAEHAIGLMLAVLRHTPFADVQMRSGSWGRARLVGEELEGKTLGIIGLGNIGRRVAALGLAFGMKVIAHSPTVVEPPPGITMMELAPLLTSADVVTLHAPQNPQTEGMINANRLSLMKPTSILINTARGALVDELALAEALRFRQLAGAGLDVFGREPPDPTSPLLGLTNVVLTPHIGSSTSGALRNIARRGGEDLARALRGEAPLHRVR
jgi:D-3-phosphoglycerate dehydrogenase